MRTTLETPDGIKIDICAMSEAEFSTQCREILVLARELRAMAAGKLIEGTGWRVEPGLKTINGERTWPTKT